MFVVTKFHDDGTMFVTTKKSREALEKSITDNGGKMESIVLKEFTTYEEALKYKIIQEEIDDKLNKIL
jgi:hypothetical protein